MTGSDCRGDASEADGWSLVSLVEALEGCAFDAVPTDTEERVVFELKCTDETMDIPALLDACDTIDPMIDRKSMTTCVAQFRGYEQRKLTAAPRDRHSQATVRRAVERRVDDPPPPPRRDAQATLRGSLSGV